MSILSDVLSLAARLFGLKRGPRIEPIALNTHWYPQPNSAQGWNAGPDRCFWCLRRDPNRTLVTNPPCTRRRPDTTELA